VGGPGLIVALDERGQEIGRVDLPSTPYGIAVAGDDIIAAMPSAGAKGLVKVGSSRRILPLVEDPQVLGAPIALSVDPDSGRFLVADNRSDVIALLHTQLPSGLKQVYKIEGHEGHLQNLSVAFDGPNHALLGASGPRGVFRFPLETPTGLGEPVLQMDGGVAACPGEDTWIVALDREVRFFRGTRQVRTVPYPAGWRMSHKAVDFDADGRLFAVLSGPSGFGVHVLDNERQAFTCLFTWEGERVVSLAVGSDAILANH
jgi:hypothetical protein